MTTITWVQDSNGNYEISSAEHLKQLMSQGTLYTDAGTPPPSYWGDNSTSISYIQTVDIDLLNDSTDIIPIGIEGKIFYGNYDGGEYTISNYHYLDPNFLTENTCEKHTGLFGINRGEYLKNIRLDGVWVIQGVQLNSGFLVGSYSGDTMLNIECNFESGSFMDANSSIGTVFIGAIVGYTSNDIDMIGITVEGSVDFRQDVSGVSAYVGGICGNLSNSSGEIRLIRNLATFPSGINGTRVGGIFGDVRNKGGTISHILNAMTGDISGIQGSTQYVGGVIGVYSETDTSATGVVEYLVNSMTGNISGIANYSYIGGIVGYLNLLFQHQKFLNYMTGDISHNGTTPTRVQVGGIIGYIYTVQGVYDSSMSNCLNAMNGNVQCSLAGNIYLGSQNNSVPHVIVSNTIANTSFGLTSTNDTSATNNIDRTGTPTGFLTNTDFTDLPYFDLTGTDNDGNSYDFDFVYGNLSGSSSYSDYTHLVLHRGDILTPYRVSYNIPDGNTTVYLTYVDTQTTKVYPPDGLTGIVTTPGVTLKLPPLTVLARSINIRVLLGGVTGAVGYRLTMEGPSASEVTYVSNTLKLQHNIIGIEPETQYTVRLYTDTGSGYTLSEQATVTTLANNSSNYDVSDFEEENGIVNISSLKNNLDLEAVIDDLFSTGDIVGISLSSNTSLTASFVKLGENLNIKDVDSTFLPFSSSIGVGQEVNLVLSDDSTTVPVTYNEVSDSVTINSVTYSDGDHFLLDGKKVTVHEY